MGQVIKIVNSALYFSSSFLKANVYKLSKDMVSIDINNIVYLDPIIPAASFFLRHRLGLFKKIFERGLDLTLTLNFPIGSTVNTHLTPIGAAEKK